MPMIFVVKMVSGLKCFANKSIDLEIWLLQFWNQCWSHADPHNPLDPPQKSVCSHVSSHDLPISITFPKMFHQFLRSSPFSYGFLCSFSVFPIVCFLIKHGDFTWFPMLFSSKIPMVFLSKIVIFHDFPCFSDDFPWFPRGFPVYFQLLQAPAFVASLGSCRPWLKPWRKIRSNQRLTNFWSWTRRPMSCHEAWLIFSISWE